MRHLASAQSILEGNLVTTIHELKNFSESVEKSFRAIQTEANAQGSRLMAAQLENSKKFRLIVYMQSITATLMEI